MRRWIGISLIRDYLSCLRLGGSFADWAITWEVEPFGEEYRLRVRFTRPDVSTGEIGEGYGRWWPVPTDASHRTIVMTGWLAARQIIEHELLEAFEVQLMADRWVCLFDPHKAIEDIAVGSAVREEVPRG